MTPTKRDPRENSKMLRLFCGHDSRESIGVQVFLNSVLRRASVPMAITPLASIGLRQGTNEFTCSRFLIPYLTGFRGAALFFDGADMLALGDVNELMALFDPDCAVQVVKHRYKTRHPRKYVGTAMEAENRDYERKNWASAMLINCEHPAWRWASYAEVSRTPTLDLLQFAFLRDSEIGELPDEWNRVVDEGQPIFGARMLHWTAGIPAFERYADAPAAALWRAELKAMMEGEA